MAGTTVRSRRLAKLLGDYRKASGLRQPEVAAYVGRTSVWVSRTENHATCRPSVGDVRSLLTLYGVTDPAEIERVVQLAADVREPGWWHHYGLSEAHASFVALESEASEKIIWEDTYIPGLLQTEDYARAVTVAGPDILAPERVEKLVRVRMERKKVLHRPVPLLLHAIIAEEALRRGGPALMTPQLRYLAEIAEMPNVTLQVLPFAAGLHSGMSGPFTILGYPDPADHDILYCQTAAGGTYVEYPGDVQKAARVFSNLNALALSPGETIGFVARYAAYL